MRKEDKLKNMELANKKLLGERLQNPEEVNNVKNRIDSIKQEFGVGESGCDCGYTYDEIVSVIDMIKSEYAVSQETSYEGAHHSDWLNADDGFEVFLRELGRLK